MIRMLGAARLAAGPVWLGMSAAAELAHRERALGALCAGLELMERELALRLTPLPQLMEELAHRTEEPARRLFSACRMGAGRTGAGDLCPRLAAAHRPASRLTGGEAGPVPPGGGAGAL